MSHLLLASWLLCASIPSLTEDKIVTETKVSDQSGKNRLLLQFSERPFSFADKKEVIARDFHSLVWETNDGKTWSQKKVIPKVDFAEKECWVSDLYSFDSSTGRAILKVAEMSKPDETNSRQCIYSWREWDILKNKQVRMIRVCKDPFEPYEKRVELPKGFLKNDRSVEHALDEARNLTQQGKYEEALQKFIWFHENAPVKAPSMSAVRLSFALSYWAELAEKYPKAKEALVDIRDKGVKKLTEGKASFDVFQEVSAINSHLNEQAQTVTLFKMIHEKRKDIAYLCFMVAEKELVAQREYQLCSSYIKNPQQNFSQLSFMRSMTRNLTKNGRPAFIDDSVEDKMFTEGVCRLIEILEGAGRHEDVAKVQAKAIASIDTPEMRKAIEEAIAKGKAR